MNKYNSYKDSGVEWIGEIPNHWKIGKLYQYSELSNGSTPSRVKPEYWENGTIPWMSSGEINKKRIREIDGRITHEGFQNSSTKLLPVGTVMMGLNGQGKTKGTVGILEIETTCNQSLCGMIFNDDIYSMFGYYFLDSQYYHVRGLVGEGQREGISTSFLSRYPLLIPPLSEQQQIVSFLDTKTSLIDSLIEKTQRKIELLKEKRQKLVEEVVLNDKIERVRLEHVVDLVKRPINREDNETYNKIGMYNWGRGIFKYPTEEGSELGDSTFNFIKEGDLLLSGQFSWEGSVSMVGKEVHNCISSHRFHILMGRKDIILNEYLWSYFTSQEGHFLLTENSFGSSGRNQPLNIGRLLKEKIPIPELSFQLKIKELVEYTRRFEKHSKRNIELLKEYRQSLISEVVTGKRKVV